MKRLSIILLLCALALGQGTPIPSAEKKVSPEQDSEMGVSANGHPVGTLDILSDTQGVDFGPYLERMLPMIRRNWLRLIPSSAETQKGKLAIEFAITKGGKVEGMRLAATSGDQVLDRAAWGSITSSSPFPPLPLDFTGPFLALRLRFYYNPDKLDDSASTAKPVDPPKAGATERVQVSTREMMKWLVNRVPPVYPQKARSKGIQGTVLLKALISSTGDVIGVSVISGDPLLAKAAVKAATRWKYRPYVVQGKAVEVETTIQMNFVLSGQHI